MARHASGHGTQRLATGRTGPARAQEGQPNLPHRIVSSSYRSAHSSGIRAVASRPGVSPRPVLQCLTPHRPQIVAASLTPRGHVPARGFPDAGSRDWVRKLRPSQGVRPRAPREVRVCHHSWRGGLAEPGVLSRIRFVWWYRTGASLSVEKCKGLRRGPAPCGRDRRGSRQTSKDTNVKDKRGRSVTALTSSFSPTCLGTSFGDG